MIRSDIFGRRTVAAILILGLFSLALPVCAESPTTASAPAWKAPGALELKDQEIRLLKQQLGQSKDQLEHERVGRIVYETQLRVAVLHGFSVKDVVNYSPLTSAVVGRLVDESVQLQYPGKTLDYYIWFNQLFGALPESFDLKATFRDLMGEQAAGIYDPHSKKLFVKTDFPLEGPMGQMILSHEICHAFQDQNYSLERLGTENAENSDLAMAGLSIAEGDATLLMAEYFARYGNPLELFKSLPGMLSMDQQKLEAAPQSIQEALLFPYMDGMKFFAALGGRTRRNPKRTAEARDAVWRSEVFMDPPTTTQQILHPELYLAGKKPVEIPDPTLEGVDKPVVNVAGEFGMRMMLDALDGSDRADTATAGWNGDKVAIGDDRTGTRRLIRWVTRWDSPKDADEFAGALEDALKARLGGALTWTGHGATREAQTATAQMKMLRTGKDGVEFQGSFEKGKPFPAIKNRPPRRKLPGLGF